MDYRSWWKKQRPQIQGFTRSFLAETPNGDKLEADYNFHDRLVRLSVEIAAEKGKIYAATVRNGTILKEKDVTSGRHFAIDHKLAPYVDIFSALPDPDLLQTIGGAYGISPSPQGGIPRRISRGVYGEPDPNRPTRYDSIFGIVRETRWQRFWRLRRERKSRRPSTTRWQRFRERFWGDLYDFSFVVFLGALVYLYYYDYCILGGTLAMGGVLVGIFDWAVRKRDILLTKVLSFLSLGSYYFYNGFTKF